MLVNQKNKQWCEYSFITDAMLGDLAKWLRLLGFDTLYFSSISDAKLTQKMRETKRILLTSDKQLHNSIKEKNNVIFVPVKLSTSEKLKVVFSRLGITKECLNSLIGTRCVYCNKKLTRVSSIEEARILISKYNIKEIPHDFYQVEDFWFCPNCKKLYWKGRMWKRIEETIKQIFIQEVNGNGF